MTYAVHNIHTPAIPVTGEGYLPKPLATFDTQAEAQQWQANQLVARLIASVDCDKSIIAAVRRVTEVSLDLAAVAAVREAGK